MQFRVDFTDNISLVYDLIDATIVDTWAKIILTRNKSDLCPHNHYIGYTSNQILTSKIARLYELADYINIHTPERVIKTEITEHTYREALNIMHVHFPLLKNDNNYKHIWNLLSEYNDIIHWLESTLRFQWGKNKSTESSYFRITLDFNKSNAEFKPIPKNSYTLFDPNVLFGELKLHYTHVGKNAHELYINNDMVCPADQFVPQRTFTASVRMHFTDDFYIDKNDWKRFYDSRGENFWNMKFEDPKLAFGYIKIGQLSKIILDNTEIDVPITLDSRHLFRKKLVGTNVLNWQVI